MSTEGEEVLMRDKKKKKKCLPLSLSVSLSVSLSLSLSLSNQTDGVMTGAPPGLPQLLRLLLSINVLSPGHRTPRRIYISARKKRRKKTRVLFF